MAFSCMTYFSWDMHLIVHLLYEICISFICIPVIGYFHMANKTWCNTLEAVNKVRLLFDIFSIFNRAIGFLKPICPLLYHYVKMLTQYVIYYLTCHLKLIRLELNDEKILLFKVDIIRFTKESNVYCSWYLNSLTWASSEWIILTDQRNINHEAVLNMILHVT